MLLSSTNGKTDLKNWLSASRQRGKVADAVHQHGGTWLTGTEKAFRETSQ